MKYLKFLIRLVLIFAIVPLTLLYPQMSSDNFSLSKYVVDMAGGSSSSDNYGISQAVGQPSPPGQMGSTNYALFNGFWAEPMPQQGILVWLPDTSGAPGDIIDIPVYAEDLTGSGILSLTFSVQADTQFIKPIMAIVGGTLLEQWGAATSNIAGDTISVGSAGIEALSGSGTLVLLRYQVKSSVTPGATATLRFTDFVFNEGTPFVNTQDGNFSVSSNYTVSGYAKYYANENPISEADAQLDGLSNETNGEGYFEVTNVPPGTYALKLAKTDDFSSAISAYDASFVLRYAVGLISLTPYQLIAADVTGNGGVSAYDASFILQFVVHLIDEFPVGERWEFIPDSYALTQSNWATAPDSIAYDPLNSNMSDQNFHGVVYGDVSGNWSPGLGLFPSSIVKTNATNTTVTWGELTHQQEKSYLLPLFIELNKGISSVYLELAYDHEKMNLDSLQMVFPDANAQYKYFDQSGVVRIAAAFIPAQQSRELKLKLCFRVPNTANELAGYVNVEQLMMDDMYLSLSAQEARKEIRLSVPATTKLYQNYPNPFNPSTTIEYQLHERSRMILKIYDVNGREVATLEKAVKSPGKYCVVWDGRDAKGNFVASGIYFYELRANDRRFSRKLVFMH